MLLNQIAWIQSHLEQLMYDSTPRRLILPPDLLFIDGFPINLATASVYINFVNGNPGLTLPYNTNDIEQSNNKYG